MLTPILYLENKIFLNLILVLFIKEQKQNIGGWVWGNHDVMFKVVKYEERLLSADKVGGSKESQKYADVMLELSLTKL